MLGFCLASSCTDLVHAAQPLWVYMCKCAPVVQREFHYSHLPLLGSYHYSTILLWWYLNLRRRIHDIQIPFRTEHFSFSFSLNLNELWASVLIDHELLKEISLMRLKDLLIHEYSEKSFESLYSLSKIIVLHSPLESMTYHGNST